MYKKESYKKTYDKIAKNFSSTRHFDWGEFDFFSKYLKKGQKVLDLGCGNGRLMDFLKKHEVNPTGMDYSSELLKIAKDKHPDIDFIQGDMTELPFADESFDLVVMLASFHHLENPKRRNDCLSEIHRILKKDGIIIMTNWNLLYQNRYSKQKKKALIRSILPHWNHQEFIINFGKEKNPRYYYAFKLNELSKLITDNFFKIREAFYTHKDKKTSKETASNLIHIAKKKPQIKICQINFDLISKNQALNKMLAFSKTGKNKFITTPNPEMCIECAKNPEFTKILNSADLSLADGTGIIWASRYPVKNYLSAFLSLVWFFFQNKKNKRFERSQGSDLFQRFCLQTDKKVFLLGGQEGVSEKCGKYFKSKNPDFKLADFDSGSSDKSDSDRIIKKINQSGASVLFVAFGAPKQEFWIHSNISKMPSIRFAMGIGGSFDFIVGTQKRAPLVFQRLGIEWLWRLIKEPKRLKRILNATIGFVKLVIKGNN
jgi:N-acetylglucosaminyldiphosphoundecaprenol N-acetyl-beta-D-mannosaminyltransferase